MTTCPRCGEAYLPNHTCPDLMPKVEASLPRDPLLQERQKTHGSFEDNAAISQNLKYIMQGTKTWSELGVVHREALDMIALKLSRILSGQANYKEHWDDVAGYAKLASEGCDTPKD